LVFSETPKSKAIIKLTILIESVEMIVTDLLDIDNEALWLLASDFLFQVCVDKCKTKFMEGIAIFDCALELESPPFTENRSKCLFKDGFWNLRWVFAKG